jgi:hypothetical protein
MKKLLLRKISGYYWTLNERHFNFESIVLKVLLNINELYKSWNDKSGCVLEAK